MQEQRFGTVALPLYAVVDGTGKVLNNFPGLTRDESEFISFLKSGQPNTAAPVAASASLNKSDAER